MAHILENLQYKLKTSSGSIALILLKLVVGAILGLTFALIGLEIAEYGHFAFFLVIVTTMAAFNRIARSWRFTGVFVFALVCALLGLLIQMYIKLAPGA